MAGEAVVGWGLHRVGIVGGSGRRGPGGRGGGGTEGGGGIVIREVVTLHDYLFKCADKFLSRDSDLCVALSTYCHVPTKNMSCHNPSYSFCVQIYQEKPKSIDLRKSTKTKAKWSAEGKRNGLI